MIGEEKRKTWNLGGKDEWDNETEILLLLL